MTDSPLNIDRIIGQVLFAANARSNGSFDEPGSNEDLIGELIARYVTPMLRDEQDQSVDENAGTIGTYIGALISDYNELKERNSALAAALGACTCFGHDDECEECAGEGTPGWAMPRQEEFAEYVRPALARIRNARTTNRPIASQNTDDDRGEM